MKDTAIMNAKYTVEGVEFTQVQMRAECTHRGLLCGGDNKTLTARLYKSDSQCAFEGDLATMSERYLLDGCTKLS